MNLNDFKDPKYAKGLVDSIAALAPKQATLMEVCGTHTVSIARNGIRNLMPEGVRLASGPGCPVCVTSNHDLDVLMALAKIDNVVVASFGDMLRVPGSTTSLLKLKAEGKQVQVVYSPLDAITFAQANPDKQVVFAGVGFETTTPLVAVAIKRAKQMGIKNFSVYSSHKNVPNALELIVNEPKLKIDALILPGHVSSIIGIAPYQVLADKYGVPGVVTGFEPLDLLQGIAMIMKQLHEGRRDIEIAYSRGVMADGNPHARAVIDEVFETCASYWRGLGLIPDSAYAIRKEFEEFDAMKRFKPEIEPTVEHKGCSCGSVLRGLTPPDKCPLFRKVCNPENPIGPCMVSSEGSCAAYYRYYS